MPDSVILSSSDALENANPEDLLPELTEPEFAYTAPGVIRRLPAPDDDGHDFDDVVMTGKFKTSDERNDPSLLFITAYRQGPIGSDPQDTFRFYDGYGVAVMPLNGQSAIDGRANIFVVHNSTAVREVVLEKVIHTGWGDAAYLVSTSEALDPDTWYNFRLHFLVNGGLEFFMAEEGTPFPVAPTIRWGAYSAQKDGTYYGMASSYSDAEQWSFDNFYISYYSERYPVGYYMIDGSDFADSVTAVAQAYAYGWNAATSNPMEPGIKLYAYYYPTSTWVLQDEHYNLPGTGPLELYATMDVADYRSPSDNYIRLALLGLYPSSFDDEADSYLYIDTVYAENWNQDFAHVGGKADIYLKDSSQMTSHHFDIYDVADEEWILEDNVKITAGDVTLPVMWITSIELLDAMGNPTGVFLTDGLDYLFDLSPYPSLRYTANEQNRLLFAVPIIGSNARVTYYTYDVVESVQDYIDVPSRRNATDDWLARICNPWRISAITLDYRGSLTQAEVTTLLVNYVLGESGDTLTWDDIEDYLNAQDNITDVDIESWTIDAYANDGSTTSYTSDTVTLSDPEHQMWVILDADVSYTPDSDT